MRSFLLRGMCDQQSLDTIGLEGRRTNQPRLVELGSHMNGVEGFISKAAPGGSFRGLGSEPSTKPRREEPPSLPRTDPRQTLHSRQKRGGLGLGVL